MAVARAEKQVTWSASNSVSVSSGGTQTSDALSLGATAFAASIMLKADNAGTPAAGDTVDFKILYGGYDPDGASTAEYDDATTSPVIAQLDTNAIDPAILTVPINAAVKDIKVYASNNASSNSITVSATVTELTA